MGEYPSPAGDEILRKAVGDPDSDVRTAACEAWGKRNTPEAATPLAGVLNGDVDQDVRLAAARALGLTHEQAAINGLGRRPGRQERGDAAAGGAFAATDYRSGPGQRRQQVAGVRKAQQVDALPAANVAGRAVPEA